MQALVREAVFYRLPGLLQLISTTAISQPFSTPTCSCCMLYMHAPLQADAGTGVLHVGTCLPT
jgi:hypothetical protein